VDPVIGSEKRVVWDILSSIGDGVSSLVAVRLRTPSNT